MLIVQGIGPAGHYDGQWSLRLSDMDTGLLTYILSWPLALITTDLSPLPRPVQISRTQLNPVPFSKSHSTFPWYWPILQSLQTSVWFIGQDGFRKPSS